MTSLRRGIAVTIAAGGTLALLSGCSALGLTTTSVATSTATSTGDTAASGDWFSQNWLTIAMVVLLVVIVFFMWRSSRRRRAEAEKTKASMVPGVQVMTSFGLFGTLVATDELANTADIEISPGNIVKVHRQTLAKVVDPTEAVSGDAPRSVEEAMAVAEAEQVAREAAAKSDADAAAKAAAEQAEAGEPRFGERIDPAKPADDTPADGASGDDEGTPKS